METSPKKTSAQQVVGFAACPFCGKESSIVRTEPAGSQQVDVAHHRMGRVRAEIIDRISEVTNSVGGVIGYELHLDVETTRRLLEIIDGIGTHSTTGLDG